MRPTIYLLAGATMALAAFAPATDRAHALLEGVLPERGAEIVMMLRATSKAGQVYEIQSHDWADGWSGLDCESRLTVGFGRFRLDWSKVISVKALGEKDIPPNIAPVPVIDGKPQYPAPAKAALEIRGSEGWLTLLEGEAPRHDGVAAIRMERQTPVPTEILDGMRQLVAACRPAGKAAN